MKREMENVVLSRPREESNDLGGKRFLVMRALARLHYCEEQALVSSIDASERELHDVLMELVSRNEVEASPSMPLRGRSNETFALTLKGRGEYMRTLGSIYELPE